MSLLGSCPCCWPLADSSVACGPEGFGCVLTGGEVGITAASVSGLESDVGDVGGSGCGPKLLDDLAWLVMMSVPALLCCLALLCPGHVVLCGEEEKTFLWRALGAGAYAQLCSVGLALTVQSHLSHFLPRSAQESKINLHILSHKSP